MDGKKISGGVVTSVDLSFTQVEAIVITVFCFVFLEENGLGMLYLEMLLVLVNVLFHLTNMLLHAPLILIPFEGRI